MCEFVSWIEHKDKVYFLTGDHVFNTPRGEMLRDWIGDKGIPLDDYVGHGAIRFYYELDDKIGTQRECTDFSSPANFPAVIVDAIKQGKMRGLAAPEQLLTESALAEYEKVEQPAWAEYEKVRQSAWAEYEKVEQSAWAEYLKVKQSAFGDLFADVNNRAEVWR